MEVVLDAVEEPVVVVGRISEHLPSAIEERVQLRI